MYLRNRLCAFMAPLTLAGTFAYATASAQAAELAVFNSRNCPYCVAWEREIGRSYESTEEGQKAPLRKLDVDGRLPAGFPRIREVEVTPTFVLIDQGREVGRIVGYDGKRAFWADMHKLLSKIPPQG
jgi:hypothetical protein